jgi:tetratricopeptide (TPR) repeat protein
MSRDLTDERDPQRSVVTRLHAWADSRDLRLALLKTESAENEQQAFPARFSTAYALTERILVGARHVWFGANPSQRGQVRLVHQSAGADWCAVEVCWDDALRDLCLLRLTRVGVPGLPAAPRLGFYDHSSAVAWDGAGFAGAATRSEVEGSRLREVTLASGRLEPAGAIRQDVFVLTVDAGPERAIDWEGMSGAPVFADACLIGIVRGTLDNALEGSARRRVEVVPLAPALKSTEVRKLLGTLRVHQVPAGAFVLPEPVALLQPDAPPSRLLQAKQRVVPFDRELRALELSVIATWLDSTAPVRLALITGAGGAGKTRLLLELCEDRRRAGWHAGFLPPGLGEREGTKIAADPRPTLVCIDYAEARPTLGAELRRLTARAEHRPLRVLLIARGAADRWRALIERPAFKDLSHGSPPLQLAAVELEGGARRRVLTSAAHSFAAVRGMDAAAALAQLSEQDLSAPELGNALYLEMLALAAVDRLSLVPDRLLDTMLAREAELWSQLRPIHDEPQAWLRALRRTIAVLTLHGGASNREQALGMVESARGPRPLDRTVDLLLRLHPGTGQPDSQRYYLDPFEPDVLGEALVYAVLAEEDAKFIAGALAQAPLDCQRTAFTLLGRLASRDSARGRIWIEALLGEEPGALARMGPAFDAALSLAETPQGSNDLLGRVLAEHVTRICPPDAGADAQAIARRMLARLPEHSRALSELAVWAARTVANDTEGETRARALLGVGHRLSAASDCKGALAATREAVELLRNLASERPDAFMPDLAMSLSDLGNNLSAVGDREGTLAATRECVELFRKLVSVHPDAFMPELATSLNNLGNNLSAVGDQEGMLAATRESVDMYRKLASERPEAFMPDLATSLSNLGDNLRSVGDIEGALSAASEAVEFRRQLAARSLL